MTDQKPHYPQLPPDDPKRTLTLVDADRDQSLPHIGLVGDTYTITLSGQDTKGQFCVIDMYILPTEVQPHTVTTSRRRLSF